MAVNVLSDELLAELLSGSRSRGGYDEALKEFIASGNKGIEVSLEAGNFAGKKPASVMTGFKSAAKREGAPAEAKEVAIIAKNDRVFLVRRDLVGGTPAPTPEAPAEES